MRSIRRAKEREIDEQVIKKQRAGLRKLVARGRHRYGGDTQVPGESHIQSGLRVIARRRQEAAISGEHGHSNQAGEPGQLAARDREQIGREGHGRKRWFPLGRRGPGRGGPPEKGGDLGEMVADMLLPHDFNLGVAGGVLGKPGEGSTVAIHLRRIIRPLDSPPRRVAHLGQAEVPRVNLWPG